MKIDVYDLSGNVVEQVNLPKGVFEAKINPTLMAQAVRVYQGNQRMASAKALTRSEVNRTTKKVYRQKGTGQARHGSRKAPIYIGGGVAMGPRGNQNYKLDLPKKMKVAALKSILSQLAADKKIRLVKGLDTVKEPKTKIMADLMSKMIDKEKLRRVAVVVENNMTTAVKSLRNINCASIHFANDLTTHDLTSSHWLVLSSESVKTLEKRLDK